MSDEITHLSPSFSPRKDQEVTEREIFTHKIYVSN